MGGVIVGAVLGILAGYAYSQSQVVQAKTKKAKKKIKEATEDFRLPRPDFKVHLPNSAEDYDILDEVICECAAQLQSEGQDLSDEFMTSVRNCVLAELYPDFEWPPVSGDHPTVQQLWTIVSYEVVRSATEGTLCVEDNAEEEDIEENPLRVQFISPPRS